MEHSRHFHPTQLGSTTLSVTTRGPLFTALSRAAHRTVARTAPSITTTYLGADIAARSPATTELARVATYELIADPGIATRGRRLSVCATLAPYRLHLSEFPEEVPQQRGSRRRMLGWEMCTLTCAGVVYGRWWSCSSVRSVWRILPFTRATPNNRERYCIVE